MRLVTDEALIEQVRLKFLERGDGNDEESPKLYWRHPIASLAQTHPPEEVLSHTGITKGWVWIDERHGEKSFSDINPVVLTEIPDGEKAKPGEFVCTLDPKTMSLSPLLEVLPDVMSDPDDRNDQAQDRREVNGNIVVADNGDIEMVENPGREAARIEENNNVGNVGVDMEENPMADHHPIEEEQDLQANGDIVAADNGNIAMVENPWREAVRVEENNNVDNVGVEMVGNPMADHHPTKEEDLRIGWRVQISRTYGTEYYVNNETGERTFEKPKLPHGWNKKLSTKHDGIYYYVNQHTGESIWEPPALPAPPAGYYVHEHAERGHYFQHKATGKTSWNHPDVPNQ
jgi:hypothetical protein